MEDLNGVSHSRKFSDIVKLCRNNVIPNTLQYPSPHLRILFKGGKNDQYTEGGERVVLNLLGLKSRFQMFSCSAHAELLSIPRTFLRISFRHALLKITFVVKIFQPIIIHLPFGYK